MAYKVYEDTQTTDSILASKDFTPTMEDFVHAGPDFIPNEGYLDHKVDLVQGNFHIDPPQATNKHYIRHTGYKVVEHVDPGYKEIDPIAARVDLGLAKVDLVNIHIKLVSAKVDLIAATADFSTLR